MLLMRCVIFRRVHHDLPAPEETGPRAVAGKDRDGREIVPGEAAHAGTGTGLLLKPHYTLSGPPQRCTYSTVGGPQ